MLQCMLCVCYVCEHVCKLEIINPLGVQRGKKSQAATMECSSPNYDVTTGDGESMDFGLKYLC